MWPHLESQHSEVQDHPWLNSAWIHKTLSEKQKNDKAKVYIYIKKELRSSHG